MKGRQLFEISAQSGNFLNEPRIHFCQLRKSHDDHVLPFDGQPIPVEEETKFLSVIFDKKLTFIPHIKKLKAKCQKSIEPTSSCCPYWLGSR